MQGLVFDFDGVIVNSEPMHEAALRLAALDLGLDFSHDDYASRYIGFDDRDFLTTLASDHHRTLTPAQIEGFNARKRDAFMTVVKDGLVAPFPGVVDLITTAARQLPIAICSGARRHEIDPILEAMGVTRQFKVIVTADDVPRSKPDPACYLTTARRLSIDPAHLLAIEDTTFGIRSALDAGYKVVAVTHSFTAEELRPAAPTRIFPTIADITLDALRNL
ncbi:MAG: HAD family phosphatase [Phycisphaerales bacterium]|nr:HAD family phosphatase [Phycisphaerales bacterium]